MFYLFICIALVKNKYTNMYLKYIYFVYYKYIFMCLIKIPCSLRLVLNWYSFYA